MGQSQKQLKDGWWKYLVLFAGFWNILIAFGMMSSTGVLIIEWRVYFDIGAAVASLIAVGMALLIPVMSPLAGVMGQLYGCGRVVLVGAITSTLSLGAAAFSPNMPFLITMICIFGFGLALIIIPCYAILGYYFKGNLAFANGVMMSGASAGVLAIVPLMQYLCTSYGWKGALLIMSAITANSVVSAMIFRPTKEEHINLAKARGKQSKKSKEQTNIPLQEPESAHIADDKTGGEQSLETDTFMHQISRDSDSDISIKERTPLQRCLATTKSVFLCVFAPIMFITRFLHVNLLWKNPQLGLLCFAAFLSALGYFSHMVYLISKLIYDMGMDPELASLLMAIIGLSGIVGGVGHGPLVDKGVISIYTLAPITLAVAGISSMMIPFAVSFVSQIILAVTFGLGTGIFIAMGPMYVRVLVGQVYVASANGLRIMCIGFGNAIGSVGMGALYDATADFSLIFYVAGALSFVACFTLAALAFYIQRKAARAKDIEVAV